MGKKESRVLDQFYTSKKTAIKCIETLKKKIENHEQYFYIEPSAGTGSFYNLFKQENIIWLDINPKSKNILKWDFFNFDITNYNKQISWKKIITIWNPPFWKNSSLALKFLNKSAEYSEYIAFILPKTFNKNSMINKIHPYLHNIYTEVIEENSFIFEWKEYNVPCVFQIWKKTSIKREKKILPITHKDFHFVSINDNPDVAIRRVWVKAGTLYTDVTKYSPSSHYYIKINKGSNFIEKFNKLCFKKYIYNTAGNPSLSKWELIEAYTNLNK